MEKVKDDSCHDDRDIGHEINDQHDDIFFRV